MKNIFFIFLTSLGRRRFTTTRVGIAHVIAVKPTTLHEVSRAAAIGKHPVLLSKQGVVEGLGAVGRRLLAQSEPTPTPTPRDSSIIKPLHYYSSPSNAFVDVIVHRDVALELIRETKAHITARLQQTHVSVPSSTSSSSSSSFLITPVTDKDTTNNDDDDDDGLHELITSTPLSDVARSVLKGEQHWQLRNTYRTIDLESFPSQQQQQQPPPRLPGTGGSYAEAALLNLRPSSSHQYQQHNRQQKGVTMTTESVRTQLFRACREGRCDVILSLLLPSSKASSTITSVSSSLSPFSSLTVDDIVAHDETNGATPLHFLVASPAAIGGGGGGGPGRRIATNTTTLSLSAAASPTTTTATTAAAEMNPTTERKGKDLSTFPLLPSPPIESPSPFILAIRSLVASGADVDAPAANGSTPLHWAAGAGSEAGVKELLLLGASPLATTYTWRRAVFGKGSAQTPAHWAGESNHPKVVSQLIDASTECVLMQDERGRTPKDLALQEGSLEAYAVLKQAEEEPFVCLRLSIESSVSGMI